MKLAKNAAALVFVLTFVFMGCSTKPSIYTYPLDHTGGASVSFGKPGGNPGIVFVALDSDPPQAVEKGKHWDPIVIPAGRALSITVHARYAQKGGVKFGGFGVIGGIANAAQAVAAVTRDVDTDVIFECPPLQAGGNYELAFTKESGMPGINVLILTDTDTKEIIYQQEF